MLLEQDATADRLLDTLLGLLGDPDQLHAMGEKARSLAHPDAARQIADQIRALAVER